MSDAVFIALVAAALAVLIVTTVILVKNLRPKNRNYSEISGGVSLDNNNLSLTGQISGKKNFHTGTILVKKDSNRIKISIYNCRTNIETIAYVVNELRIGRTPEYFPHDPDAYTVTGDAMVSGIHCTLYNYAGTLALTDNNSSNHTYLNTNMVTNPVYVRNGDRLTVGQTDLIIGIL